MANKMLIGAAHPEETEVTAYVQAHLPQKTE